MTFYNGFREILKVQKFRRIVSYTGFYCFTAVVTYAYTNNTTRAGYSRADQYYASYPAGTELLTDAAKLYKQALGYCFEVEEWGPIEWCVMADHFDRQGKAPYEYHAICVSGEGAKKVALSMEEIEPLSAETITALSPVFVRHFDAVRRMFKYMAHLVSHGQLEGSG